MLTFIARRLLAAAPMLMGVSIAAFLLLHALPGDPARAILGQRATEENVRKFREAEGLEDSLPVQYGRFLADLAEGELGRSHRSNRPVVDELKERVPATIELALFAMLFACVVGMSLGVLAAIKPRTIWDFICLAFALVGVSMPIFWLGFLVQKVFSTETELSRLAGTFGTVVLSVAFVFWLFARPFERVKGLGRLALGAVLAAGALICLLVSLGVFAGDVPGAGTKLFPFQSRMDISQWPTFESETGFFLIDAIFVYRNAELSLHVLHHLMLPAMVLATVPMALIARMTRANMLEVLDQDYVRTARAKGLAPRPVILRHAMRNALIPVVTAIGTQFGYLLGGAVLTETIFAWPGMGTYVIEAIDVLDAKPLQASVMLIAVFFISVNLLTDLSYAVIDPRLRHGGGKSTEAVPGVTWLQVAPWGLAALPWLATLVVAIWASTPSATKPAVATAWLILLPLIALEVIFVIGVGVKEGWFRTAFDGAGQAIRGAVTRLASSFGEFFKFLRRHKPAVVGTSLILLMVIAAVGAPLIAPYDPMQGLQRYNEPASGEFWLGTDAQGRDLFSRLVWGARTTLLIALAATLLSLLLGTIVGGLAGYFGGALDSCLMRAVDFMMSFPSFLLAVVTVAVLGRSVENLIWAVGIVGIPLFARQVRAEVLRVKALEFVEAARAMGAGRMRILLRSVLPNCVTPIIVLGTLGMGSAILDVAGLAFLGLGGDPFVPEWGLILKLGWDESSKGAFQVGVAGVCILGTVLGFNLLGDGLRDWLDPRSRNK